MEYFIPLTLLALYVGGHFLWAYACEVSERREKKRREKKQREIDAINERIEREIMAASPVLR